jgi:predicted hotdog family 3-hydroxylacyl-ACP dehydratase
LVNPVELLPHRAPMILLDEVLAHDADALTAVVEIGADTLFAEPEGVPAYVGIEYMAQACGAFVGALARAAGQEPRIGYLLGTRNFEANVTWFRPRDRLVVTVTPVVRDEMMGAFDCRIARGGEVLATAQLNVYQPADAPRG